MPHLTLQISPLGPVVNFYVGVSKPRAEALSKAGQTVPTPVLVSGLIDTGASGVCIDPNILAPLQLTQTGVVYIHTPSTGGVPQAAPQYDVSIILAHPKLNFTFHSVAVIQSALQSQGIQALIGRDILKHCLLGYDGVSGIFVLSF